MGIRLSYLALPFLLVACGGSAKKSTDKQVGGIGESDGLTVPRVDASLCDSKGKTVQTFDLNDDGEPDVWKTFVTANEGGTTVQILTCKQVDLDHDRKIDFVQTYSRTGELIAEEFDFTFEGSVDAREHYDKKTGKIMLIERDTDHDRKPDVWEKYDSEGRIESVRRDRNADGKPDLWEQYKDGILLAILYDEDFDNKVDRKHEVKLPEGPKPEADGEEVPDEDVETVEEAAAAAAAEAEEADDE